MNSKLHNGVLTVYLTGHIDSTNADSIEEQINELRNANEHTSLIIDIKDLAYISSAGLRIMLKLRRVYQDLRITNASREVYEIFDMTGFTQMMTVEKAYREFDVTGCEVVGEGANGKVYRIDRDTIVKVYKDADSLDEIKRERELARTAFVLGIPTAIPYDVVKVGDTYGSVFELLNAKSYAELLREDASQLDLIAKKIAEVAKIMHTTQAPDTLPHQRDTALRWVDVVENCFTPQQHQKLKGLVENLPENGTMLHGDFHIKNIMAQNGETLLIDMDTLCTGHPIYELAFMFNAYRGFGVNDKSKIEDFLGISIDTARKLWRRSLGYYLETDDEERLDEVEDKAALIGYLRIMRRCMRLGDDKTPEGKALVETCHDKIADLLGRIDTLEF